MHLLFYRLRPDVRAVCHAHPPIATGFAVAGSALNEAILPEVDVALPEIPLAPYGAPGTGELCQSLEPFVAGYDSSSASESRRGDLRPRPSHRIPTAGNSRTIRPNSARSPFPRSTRCALKRQLAEIACHEATLRSVLSRRLKGICPSRSESAENWALFTFGGPCFVADQSRNAP